MLASVSEVIILLIVSDGMHDVISLIDSVRLFPYFTCLNTSLNSSTSKHSLLSIVTFKASCRFLRVSSDNVNISKKDIDSSSRFFLLFSILLSIK